MARIQPTQRVVPTRGSTEIRLPAKLANHRFKFVQFARCWGFFDEVQEYLPTLGKIVGKPAANGVTADGDMAGAIAGALSKGGVLIDDVDKRLKDHVHYVGQTSCWGGGWHHGFYADAFIQLGPKDFTLDHDRDTWIDFLRTVKHSGIIEPMEDMVYRGLIRAQETRLNRFAVRGTARPSVIEAAEQRLANMKSVWAADLQDRADAVAAEPPKRVRSHRQAVNETTPNPASTDEPKVTAKDKAKAEDKAKDKAKPRAKRTRIGVPPAPEVE